MQIWKYVLSMGNLGQESILHFQSEHAIYIDAYVTVIYVNGDAVRALQTREVAAG